MPASDSSEDENTAAQSNLLIAATGPWRRITSEVIDDAPMLVHAAWVVVMRTQGAAVTELEFSSAFHPVSSSWLRRFLSSDWRALPVLMAGTFMIVLDFFIVNVTVPSMQAELHASASA